MRQQTQSLNLHTRGNVGPGRICSRKGARLGRSAVVVGQCSAVLQITVASSMHEPLIGLKPLRQAFCAVRCLDYSLSLWRIAARKKS
eukprot:1160758-Pelagomonas_calceolata.AAC.2